MNRAIDRYEDAICRVVDADFWDESVSTAINQACAEYGLTVDRLKALVRMWCAIGGVKLPAECAE